MKESSAGLSSTSLAIVLLITAFFAYFHRWTSEDKIGWEALVDGDSKGYYVYLPAYFIYDNADLSFFQADTNETIKRYYSERLMVETSSGVVIKNYAGVAAMISPFFGLGHILAILKNEPLTGYSWPYMLMVIVAAIFYFMLGLYFMSKLLKSFQVSDTIIAFVFLLTGLGTNLLYYTAVHAAMSHVYSFALIAGFAYFIRMYCLNISRWFLVLSGLILGLIVLVRPVNLLVVFAIPFLAGNFEVLRRAFLSLFNKPYFLLLAILLFLIAVAIQPAMYFWQTGHWIVWSYGEEGFHFSRPEIMKVLFSFRKGLFVYTPVFILMGAGLITLLRKNKFSAFSFSLFFALLVYIIASWWNWYYGDGFGMRPFIDYYSIMMIPIAIFLNGIPKLAVKISVLFLLSVFIVFGLVQNYQYRYQIIHPSAMNFEKYKYVFFKTGDRFRNVLGTDTQLSYFPVESAPALSFVNDFERPYPEWSESKVEALADGAFSGKQVAAFDSLTEFGSGVTIPVNAIPIGPHGVYARIVVKYRQQTEQACKDALLVFTIEDSTGNPNFYNAEQIADFPRKVDNVWRSKVMGLILPFNFRNSSKIKAYVWNKGRKKFYADDLRVTLHKINNFD